MSVIYRSKGYLFTEPDIPQCGYCGENYEEIMDAGYRLYETCTSGVLVCDKENCTLEYIQSGEIVEKFTKV